MKRTLAALATVAAAVTLAACGGSGDEPQAEPSSPEPSTTSPAPVEPQDDEPGEAFPVEATNVDDLTADELSNIHGYAVGKSVAKAAERFGAEAAYVAVVVEESWTTFDAFPELRDAFTNSDLVGVGSDVCTRIGDGMTLDEIFMADYDEAGLTPEEDSMFLFADFVWSTVLHAPETLCPEHVGVVTEWEEAAH